MRSAFFVSVLMSALLQAEEALLLRYPAPSPDGKVIAFSWHGDLWLVPSLGGEAKRITANPGYDWGAVWDASGSNLAFVSDRFGNDDIYLFSFQDGKVRRLSFHESGDRVQGFLQDQVVFTSRRHEAWNRKNTIYLLPESGGTERLLTQLLALEAVPSPDGKFLALVRGGSPDWRRHYRGSANRDLWLLTLDSGELRRLTTTPWDEDHVSWAGVGALVFRSDNGGEDRNVFLLELKGGTITQLTHHKGADVRYPKAAADGSVVAYEFGDGLYLVPADGSASPRRLAVSVSADVVEEEVERVALRDKAEEVAPSPDGTQVALVIKGDIYVTARRPKELAALADPVTVRVTATPGREREIAWSPDGKSLLYASDRFGQYDLFRAEPVAGPNFVSAGRVKETRLTSSPFDERRPRFSPDGKTLAYLVGKGNLTVAEAAGNNPRTLFQHWGDVEFSFSPDSRWLAFSRDDENFNSDVFIIPVTGGPEVNVSQHPDEDLSPVWSPDGRRLYWLSRRHNRSLDIWAVYLTKEDHERSPEQWIALFEEEGRAKRADDKTNTGSKPVKPVHIDLASIHERARPVTSLAGDEGEFVVASDSRNLVFVASPDGKRDLYKVRFDGREVSRLTDQDVRPSQLSHLRDPKLVIYRGRRGTVESITLEGKPGDPISFYAFYTVPRRALREQVFQEAWRELERNFYDPQFHGFDWRAIGERYRPLAAMAWADRDFEQVMNWMLGELNASHMGYRLPTPDADSSLAMGFLGVEVEPSPNGRGVVVREVVPDTPAAQSEVRLRPGDVILAVNGEEILASKNFFAFFEGLAGRWVRLAVGTPAVREVQVKLTDLDTVRQARYQAWVKERRAIVERLSQGRLGYIHIQGMNAPSLEEFQRELFAAARGREGLLIDVRNNGGGWTTDYLLAILTVRRHAWTVPRGMDPSTRGYPQDRLPLPAWTRPVAALCDEASYSNAEIFSWAFKTLKRGPLVGMTTFGAVISTGGTSLVDGSFVRLPFRGWYVAGSGINMERQGCEPDVLVEQPPYQDLDKERDAQLERAVEVLLAQLPGDPSQLPW